MSKKWAGAYQASDEMTSQGGIGQNAQLQSKIDDLKKRNAKLERMLAMMGTKSDTSEARARYTKEEKACAALIKDIIKMIKSYQGSSDFIKDLRQDFDIEVGKFQELSQKTENRERAIMTAMGADATLIQEELGGLDDDQKKQRMQQIQDQKIDSQFMVYNEAEIARRHEHVLAIERDAQEIFEMYKELKGLVNEQQASIDIIDNNVQDAKAKVEQGHEQLVTAEEYQKKARTRQCCILAIAVAVVAAIVLAAWLGSS
jgi:syntaxin 7